jgi:hypothetical protein
VWGSGDTVIIARLVVGDIGPGGSKLKKGKGKRKPKTELRTRAEPIMTSTTSMNLACH